MMKIKGSDLTRIIAVTFAIGVVVGWIGNNIEYNNRPYTIDLRKEQFIRAQQKCGVNNVATKVDEDSEFKRFDCIDWAEATQSGVQK